MFRSPILALAAGFLLLGGIVVSIAIFASGLQSTNDSLTKGLQRNLDLSTLMVRVQGAETGQRGYLLTGDRAYLDAHAAAIASVDDSLRTLAAPSTDGFAFLPENLERLRTAVGAKMTELEQTIAIAEQGRRDEAIAIVRTDRGETLMQNIRDVVAVMTMRSTATINDAIQRERAAAVRLWGGIAAAAIGIVLLAAWLIRDARQKEMALIAQAGRFAERNQALEVANSRLDEESRNRQAAEDQLRQLQKMEAIGQLTGGIAHDFNNVLAVVLSAVGLIRRRLAARQYDDIGKLLDGAAESAERAASLTRRLLAFARQQPLEPEPLDANKLVQGMSELLRSTLGEAVSLETVLAGGLWRIHADARQLENSILNLAVNARDAMPDGGKLTIETANSYLDDAYVAHNPGSMAGQFVMVAVSDTGTGMPPEVIAKAFDPFFTTKEAGRGTGLGLSQVYGFIRQSHGHIKIYSEIGAGTTIKMYVPRYLGEAVEAVPRAPTPASVGGTATEVILVAEDDERLRSMVVDTLNELGYTVIAAANGAEALEFVKSRGSDLVLLFTDIVMPGMSGRKLADEAQVLRPGLKVLYTTGFTRNAVVHNGVLDAGVMFLPKPFTVEALAAKVRQVIDG